MTSSPSDARDPRTVTETRSIRLRDLGPDDLEALHSIAMIPSVRRRWRTRGRWIEARHWETYLVGGSAWQSVAIDRDSDSIFGYVELTDLNLLDGHAQITAFASPDLWRSGLPAEMIAAFMREVFARYPIGKLYLVVASDNLDAMSSLSQRFPVEGRLLQFLNCDGVRVDSLIIGIPATLFATEMAKLEGRMRPAAGQPATAVEGETVGPISVIADSRSISPAQAEDTRIDALDSLEAVELLIAIEDARGHEVAPELLGSFVTVADAERFARS